MQRPANYKTKQGEAIIAYLASQRNNFVTAAQIANHLKEQEIAISRPTVYRQLDKLERDGKVRKYIFGDAAVSSFQYIDPENYHQDLYHLKCEICDGIFDLHCDEVDNFSRHIFESHAFQVNGGRTIFYGKCKLCQQ